jgi:hypothetical protein
MYLNINTFVSCKWGGTFLNMEGSVRPTDTGFLRRGDGPQLDSASGISQALGDRINMNL